MAKKMKEAVKLGKLGGIARKKSLSPSRRSEISQQAARKRWGNRNPW